MEGSEEGFLGKKEGEGGSLQQIMKLTVNSAREEPQLGETIFEKWTSRFHSMVGRCGSRRTDTNVQETEHNLAPLSTSQ
jgi:hypothetical protein